jgi:hypothetical protein
MLLALHCHQLVSCSCWQHQLLVFNTVMMQLHRKALVIMHQKWNVMRQQQSVSSRSSSQQGGQLPKARLPQQQLVLLLQLQRASQKQLLEREEEPQQQQFSRKITMARRKKKKVSWPVVGCSVPLMLLRHWCQSLSAHLFSVDV